MKTVFAVLLLAGQIAWGASGINGLTIPNAHVVASGNGVVIRGSQPLNKINELKRIGVTDVIIFKQEVKNEVQSEIASLKAAGIHVHHFPFRWQNVNSEEAQCEMIIEALRILKEVYEHRNRVVYFHCTFGEDRTGLLAGLFELLFEGESAADIFKKDMCGKGYEAGSERKPSQVVNTIRKELTPTFVKMASLMKSGRLSYNNLDIKVCPMVARARVDASAWRCH